MQARSVLAGLALVLLALACAWQYGMFESEDEAVAQLKELAAQPRSEERDQDIRELMQQNAQRMEGATDDQRLAAFEQVAPILMPMMMARFEQEYDKFMAMSPEEQRRELDRRIDEMRAGRGRLGQGMGGGPRTGGGGDRGRPNISPERMDSFRKKMLDWVTPEQRGKFQNGVMLFNARLQERGMEPVGPPGGGFF